MSSEETRERIKSITVKERVDSEHQSLTVWVEAEKNWEEKRRDRKKKEEGVNRGRKRKFMEYFGRKEEG